MDPSAPAQEPPNGALYLGIAMHRIDDLDVGVALDDVPQPLAELDERTTEALSPVRRHEEESAGRIDRGDDGLVIVDVELLNGPLECIDNGIARDLDLLHGDTLVEEIAPSPLGGGEVPLGERGRHAAVQLLGERRIAPVRAETRLDVTDGDPRVEGGERGRESAGGVALDQYGGRTHRSEHRGQAVKDPRGHL